MKRLEGIHFQHDEASVVDLGDPTSIEAMEGFISGRLTAEQAGPAFSHSPEGGPVIDVSEETFDTFNGTNGGEDHIVRGEN